MELAGLTGYAELAERIGQHGLGERTLRKLADDEDTSRTARRTDIIAIAEATGLPPAFFTLGDTELASALDVATTRSDHEQRLTALEDDLRALRRELAATAVARIAQEAEASRRRSAGSPDRDPSAERTGDHSR